MRQAVAVLLVIVVAGGCGKSSGSPSHSSEIRPAQIAHKMGCADTYKAENEPALGVREEGRCTLDGAEVSIFTFSSNTARDGYVQVAQQFGGRYAVVDRVAVTSESSGAVDHAASALHAEVK